MATSTIVVASVSARPFVQSLVRAGYDVIAIDIFKDIEIQLLAKQSYQVTLENGTVNMVSFKSVLAQINWQYVDGFVYGSGFETAPELLDLVKSYTEVLGNTREAVTSLKRLPNYFELLHQCQINYPAIQVSTLADASGWIEKHIAGAGGMHIRLAKQGQLPHKDGYFQYQMTGEPISALFLADGENARLIGFNKQYLAPNDEFPYRYGGAVSNVLLPQKVKEILFGVVQTLTNRLGLRGLNSLDAIVEQENVWVLEVNPRLSATVALYEAENQHESLLAWHIAACHGQMPLISLKSQSKATAIVYAELALQIVEDFEWPDWVNDIPVKGSKIAYDAPVCSVLAEARTAVLAEDLLKERVNMIKTKIRALSEECVC